MERRHGTAVPAAPRSPLGSPTRVYPSAPAIHPSVQALGVNRGSGRGRVRRALFSADLHVPTVASTGTTGRCSDMAVRGRRRRRDDGRRAAAGPKSWCGSAIRARPDRAGTGFVADHHGTVVTSHEAVDGLARLVLHAAGDRTCVVTADAVTPLPGPGPGARPHRRAGAWTRCPSPLRDGVATGRVRPDRGRRLARGAGAGHGRRHVHGDRRLPSARRRPGAGDRHGRAATRCGWAAGRPGARCSTSTTGAVVGRRSAPRCAAPSTAPPASPCPCAAGGRTERPAGRAARPQRGDRARLRRPT